MHAEDEKDQFKWCCIKSRSSFLLFQHSFLLFDLLESGGILLFLINSGHHGGISGLFVNEISCLILRSDVAIIQLIHRSSIILSSLSTEEFNIYFTNGKQRYHPRGLAEESPEIFQAHYGNYSQQCRSTLRVRRDRHGKVARQQTDTRQPPPLVGPPIGHQTLTTRGFIHCTQSLSQLPVHVWHYANISPALVQLFVAASTDLMNK